MHSKQAFLKKVSKKDKEKAKKAINFVEKKVSKKEPQLVPHFIETGEELRKFGLENDVVVAGILHETLQKNMSTKEELEKEFGKKTADLVKECSDILSVIQGNIKKMSPEVLMSLVLSISVDIQSLMIRIASALSALEHPKRHDKKLIKDVAKATSTVYLPLATKLGMGETVQRMQDSTFRIENPGGYKKARVMLKNNQKERKEIVENAKKEIKELLRKKVNAEVFGRPKGYKSIYEKIKKTSFKHMYDIYGVRIICKNEKECYEALGIIHANYRRIPDAFDDYISKPKSNGYKSIHTAIIKNENIIEVQIRTWDQHLKIESNLYWEYKSIAKTKSYEKYLRWERQLVEWQKSLGKSAERKGIENNQIFVFTPKKEVVQLPRGASVIDFAYAIHTDLGHKIGKAEVNGKAVPIESELNNLDHVSIIPSKKRQVNGGWLSHVKTEKAKSKIRAELGLKGKQTKPTKKKPSQEVLMKKIKLAECCHPLPGEDVIGYKTTKRKIIIHKKNCLNIKNLDSKRLVEIEFERDRGKTELRITGVDRIGLLGEMLTEIKKGGATIVSTNFNIKDSGYVETIFGIEIKSIKKLETIMERLSRIPSVHSVERK